VTIREDEAAQHLKRAHILHSNHRIDEAITEARAALDFDSGYTEALTYLGTTLITRRLDFRGGLVYLEKAAQLAPDDAGVHYSLGWCYEFVAYRLEKQATSAYRDPIELYELGAAELQRCIDLDPEAGLKADAEDLLESIQARLE
jgi:tetratricopeptide (TPR) repeat protein